VALLAAGCGGGDDTTTTTTNDLAISTGADLAGARLQAGTYNVTNLVMVADGCGLVFEGDAANNIDPLATLQVTNTGTMLSLGNKFDSTSDPKWSPAGYSGGTGVYTDATHATLTTQATATLADGCTYDLTRTSTATFTGMNMLSVDFTDVETNYDAATCAADMPPMTPPCTSHYTFDLAM
jgi:hypothetical protein